MKFVHQFDFRGRHRLVVNGNAGKWMSYQGIAVNGDYRAVTDFYGESVYKVIEQENTIEGICAICEKPLPAEGKYQEGCEHVIAEVEKINASMRRGN